LNRLADDLEAANADEFLAGVSTTLGDWMLGVDVSRRQATNLIDELPLVSEGGAERIARTGDYVFDRTLTGVDFEGDPYSIDAQRLRPGLNQVGLLRQNGDREQEMYGATLFFNKRLANRWMLRGHFNVSDWTGSVPESGTGDANDLLGPDDNDGAPAAFEGGPGRDGLFLNSRWSFGASGLYQIVPDRPWGLDLAWDVYGRDGNLSPAWATLRGGDSVSRRLQIGDVDRRLPDLYIVNLRVSTRFSIGRSDLGLSFDLLNAAGADTTLQQDRDASSATHGAITERLSPRVFQVGARLTFR
jgi:hypothetical protein